MINSITGALNTINTNNVGKLISLNPNSSSTGVDGTQEMSFENYLSDALTKVNNLQQESEVAQQKLATGEVSDIHSVMIASQKAELALQFTLAVRNKIMDAYSEIMRMQV